MPPVVVSSANGHQFRNGGAETCVEHAFRLMTDAAAPRDPLEALVEGVTIVELDPAETSVGRGSLPNADGVVQLDASCMDGPRRRAGGVAALEGIATAARVAHAVLRDAPHHLLAGQGAQDFAVAEGFTIEICGYPNFNVKLYVVNAAGECAGVALYGGDAVRYAVCTAPGAELRVCEALIDEVDQFLD